jgi:competence protein ComEA
MLLCSASGVVLLPETAVAQSVAAVATNAATDMKTGVTADVTAGTPAMVQGEGGQPKAAQLAEAVDINTASAEELAASLSGVGASKAEAIVRYREQFGPFASIDELTEVAGIGAATVERNRALMRLR